MDRHANLFLKDVAPLPKTLTSDIKTKTAADKVAFTLSNLFYQQFVDSFPHGPPNPDPSRFEYLDRIAACDCFCLLDYVTRASLTKRRAISTELGQAFCRLMLTDHFSMVAFAHMADVLDRPGHAAFNGVTVRRLRPGDAPDYLCAGRHGRVILAEAKGRMKPIAFSSQAFGKWREQFSRVGVYDRKGRLRTTKGFIVATHLASERSTETSSIYIEDPNSPGDGAMPEEDLAGLRLGISAMHYGRFIKRLGLAPLASALSIGYPLTGQLTFQVPVWTCFVPPFAGVEFIGGFMRSTEGGPPRLGENGWELGPELGVGHAVFIGIQRATAEAVARAARGEWNQLFEPPIVGPSGRFSSDLAWLPDGTTAAPLTYFLPTGQATL